VNQSRMPFCCCPPGHLRPNTLTKTTHQTPNTYLHIEIKVHGASQTHNTKHMMCQETYV